ncbi:MAG: site-2 protease family protein [Candidatus Omnitrophica bacterium]|nr:site-2 protease family protein [Candidatus Omnitrophota bacterium]
MTMIAIALIFICIVIPAVVLHEYAHAWVADKLGDPTARLRGRLSFNPLKHIDPVGTVLVPLLLYLPYAIGWTQSPIIFGFAKAVPFNPLNLRHPRRDIMLVRLAGPCMNILIALVFAKAMGFVQEPHAYKFFATAVMLNLGLAVFNMLPIPPLDGSGVLYAILPVKLLPVLARVDSFVGVVIVFTMLNLHWLDFMDNIIFTLARWMGVGA